MNEVITKTMRTYAPQATALAFPLGGIGTGNVSLGARGNLRDWELFNKPAKNSSLPNSFFAIRLQPEGEEAFSRVLEGPVQPPHHLGFGYAPETNAGLPRFQNASFRGEYPFAWLTFDTGNLPASISLEAYTPFIPLQAEDSGIPCAILTYTVRNTGGVSLAVSLAGSITNPATKMNDTYGVATPISSHNEFRDEPALRGLFYSVDCHVDDLKFGNMALVTDHKAITAKPAWFRGAWFDYLQEFWDDFTSDGLLTDLCYTAPAEKPDTGSLCLSSHLAPGEECEFRFVLTWYFPNRPRGWGKGQATIRNQYAARFTDAWKVGQYVLAELHGLEEGTRTFHRAFFSSTLPSEVLDAVSANIVPLRSTTCFWTEDGRFYGWEGCHDNEGCCHGSCTHVWSYAQTLAYLFPSLERAMRDIEFIVETEPDGYMAFRTMRTFDPDLRWDWQGAKAPAAVDGQMGSILRTYREWTLCGDRQWLHSVWPGVKRSLSYAAKQWDADGDGVLEGVQHNTYDIEFHGPNPLGSIYYLAALRAVEEMAKAMDENELAADCQKKFSIASVNVDSALWDGDFFVQRIENVDAYKYQFGLGCLSDQLLGQLHAHLLGLGALLPEDHLRKAGQSIYKYNFRQDFRNHTNCQRTYVLNDEAGLLMCSWPKQGRPRLPFVYSDEVWTGTEYQVAAELIYLHQLDEGLSIVRAVRSRHDGVKRNPWNEVECGHHYARSMSSWAVLLALTGQQGDVANRLLSFAPVAVGNEEEIVMRRFWSNGVAWGVYEQVWNPARSAWAPSLQVLGGNLDGFTVEACGKTWTNA
jgi:non-lysosomal glucosylceramidase